MSAQGRLRPFDGVGAGRTEGQRWAPPLGLVTAAPELRGQQRAYLEQQLQAFKVAAKT